jgi:hypothetical protein
MLTKPLQPFLRFNSQRPPLSRSARIWVSTLLEIQRYDYSIRLIYFVEVSTLLEILVH